jgi:hypothetical protein
MVVYPARFRDVVGLFRGIKRGGGDHETGRDGGAQKAIFTNKAAKEKAPAGGGY